MGSPAQPPSPVHHPGPILVPDSPLHPCDHSRGTVPLAVGPCPHASLGHILPSVLESCPESQGSIKVKETAFSETSELLSEMQWVTLQHPSSGLSGQFILEEWRTRPIRDESWGGGLQAPEPPPPSLVLPQRTMLTPGLSSVSSEPRSSATPAPTPPGTACLLWGSCGASAPRPMPTTSHTPPVCPSQCPPPTPGSRGATRGASRRQRGLDPLLWNRALMQRRKPLNADTALHPHY